jgi:hypothetical protein
LAEPVAGEMAATRQQAAEYEDALVLATVGGQVDESVVDVSESGLAALSAATEALCVNRRSRPPA